MYSFCRKAGTYHLINNPAHVHVANDRLLLSGHYFPFKAMQLPGIGLSIGPLHAGELVPVIDKHFDIEAIRIVAKIGDHEGLFPFFPESLEKVAILRRTFIL